jgi:hypothetical protein
MTTRTVVIGDREVEMPPATRGGFRCERLHATIPVWCCLLRQSASSMGRTLDAWRGQGPLFPSCTPSCEQGAAMAGSELVTWRGAGPGGRFERGRNGAGDQAAARARLRARGLLDVVPSLDEPPGTPDSSSEC